MQGKTANAQVLAEVDHFVIYGLSHSLKGFAKEIVDALSDARRDARITVVHPEADSIADFTCVRSAKSARNDSTRLAIVALAEGRSIEAIEDASGAGIESIWLAMNACTPKTRALAESKGMKVFKGCPILFLADPKGFHGFHQRLARFFGRL